MATSQNGWGVLTTPPPAEIPEFITGRVRPEDVDTIFTYLCHRFNDGVEEIRKEWSWGWNFRPIRGATSGFSNHASATAIDLNAPAHPLGVNGTFTQRQIEKVHEILADLKGVVRWGQDYSGRKDGMHFEIDANAQRVSTIAQKIRNGNMPDQRAWRPNTARAVHFGRVQEQFLIAAGVQEGEIVRRNGVALIQNALNEVFPNLHLEVDGFVGRDTLNAWGRWEDRVGGRGRPRIPDRKTVEELAEKVGLEIKGEPWD